MRATMWRRHHSVTRKACMGGAGLLLGLVLNLTLPVSSQAAVPACKNPANFERWLQDFKREAVAQGISQSAVERALSGVTFDPQVVRRDHGQGVFQQSYLQFAGRMAGTGRYQNGLKQLKANAALFARIEQRFGVPPAV